MLLPITFTVPPVAAMIMLAGIYYGAQYAARRRPSWSTSRRDLVGGYVQDGYQMRDRAGQGPRSRSRPSFVLCRFRVHGLIALFGPPIAE
jgi:hypothetical protein